MFFVVGQPTVSWTRGQWTVIQVVGSEKEADEYARLMRLKKSGGWKDGKFREYNEYADVRVTQEV